MRLFAFWHLQTKGSFNLNLVFFMTLISSVGFLMLYSAADCHLMPWTLKQMIRFICGLGIFWLVSAVDIRFWLSQAFFIYAACLGLLFVVELLGFVGMGARRWVDLYAFQIQPSELMKISLVLALASYFHRLEDRPKLQHLIIPILLILLPSLFVLRQPDLGTATILILVGGSLFYAIGVRLWVFAAALLGAGSIFPILWTYLKDYQKKRILTFLNPEQDPLGSGYHILQSKIAIGSGGFWGKGFNQGTQSHLDFLPEKQTDFIFTMLCEEWGFVGGVVLIVLYVMLLIKCFRIALLEARYVFSRLVVVGVTSMLFFHVFINMGMVMGVLPVVGVPLPFMSYGGTSMLTLMIGLGLVGAVNGQKETRLSSYFSV